MVYVRYGVQPAPGHMLVFLRAFFCHQLIKHSPFVGLASFLRFTGLYNSAVSVAQDVKLRKSIKTSALQQSSKLLDSIGTAEVTKEIERKVISMTEQTASSLMEQSGVEPSLIDGEIRSHLDEVLEELVKVKRGPPPA
jgi:uncharacterized protein YicC (UPF0701 family)